MQTTIDLDDDLIEPARALAARQDVSIDGLVSNLVRYEIGRHLPLDERNPLYQRSSSGVLAFRRRHGGRPVTMELVKALMDEEDRSYFE